jgi:hypothetical protein
MPLAPILQSTTGGEFGEQDKNISKNILPAELRYHWFLVRFWGVLRRLARASEAIRILRLTYFFY